MAFDSSDPRSSLITAGAVTAPPLGSTFAPPQLIPFSDANAARSALGTRTWWVRIQHAVVAYSEAVAGDCWEQPGSGGETVVVLPNADCMLEIDHEGQVEVVRGASVSVIPPGKSVIRVLRHGVVVRVIPSSVGDRFSRCLNGHDYAEPIPNVRPYVPVVGPPSLHSYFLDDYPPTADRFGSIFQSKNLMVNIIDTMNGPRDPTKLSPHSHADFEQCSLQLEGEFVHHARTPWTPDLNAWRADDHLRLRGAGAVIFPPSLVHTSQAVGLGKNRLVDIFAPPRQDFLGKAGWVLNAADFT